MFWEFDESVLPEGYTIDSVPSSTGDDCHRNIIGITDNQLRKMLIKLDINDFKICDGDQTRRLTQEDLLRYRPSGG